MRLWHGKSFPITCGWLIGLVLLQNGCAWRQQQGLASTPVAYQHIVRHDPNLAIHVVTVDLSDPRVSVRVSRGGPAPDGHGPWATSLLPVSEIAGREGFDIAINRDMRKVVNSPSDTKERPVADALGITVHAPMPAPD